MDRYTGRGGRWVGRGPTPGAAARQSADARADAHSWTLPAHSPYDPGDRQTLAAVEDVPKAASSRPSARHRLRPPSSGNLERNLPANPMSSTTCEQCGTVIPAGDDGCAACGAARESLHEGTDSDGVDDEISDAADSLRGDQWKTYIAATVCGVVVASLLVFTIVQQAFLDSGSLTERGPSYADSAKGARAFLQNHVLSQLEMKYSGGDNRKHRCEQIEEVSRAEGKGFRTKVRCQSPERTIRIGIDLLHGRHSMDWTTRILETRSK